MFDDLKKDTSSTPGGTEPAPAKPEPQQPVKNKMDDMFADVDPVERPSAVQSGKIKPAGQTPAPVQQPATPTPNIPPNEMMVKDARDGGRLKKMLIIVLSIVIVAAIGWAVYTFFIANSIEIVGPEETTNTNVNIGGGIINENVDEEPEIIPDDEILDDDYDGLSNAEERRLGTNPSEADTDNDGLFDQDEIEIHKTSPISTDTDNDGLNDWQEINTWYTDPNEDDTDDDGYSDGTEVDNGYNPLGDGTIDNWAPPLQN